jgi:hypothetical protein
MDGKYKVWMTQGQGCGERPDAEFDTLDEALQEAAGMFGEGSVGIELPDGSWHEFGPEWDMRAKVTLLRMRRDGLNPKQKWLMRKWEIQLLPVEIRILQHGAHTFTEVWESMRIVTRQLFCDSLAWGLFDVFEVPTGVGVTDKQIDWLMEQGKKQE